jgi:hypothetical protein
VEVMAAHICLVLSSANFKIDWVSFRFYFNSIVEKHFG